MNNIWTSREFLINVRPQCVISIGGGLRDPCGGRPFSPMRASCVDFASPPWMRTWSSTSLNAQSADKLDERRDATTRSYGGMCVARRDRSDWHVPNLPIRICRPMGIPHRNRPIVVGYHRLLDRQANRQELPARRYGARRERAGSFLDPRTGALGAARQATTPKCPPLRPHGIHFARREVASSASYWCTLFVPSFLANSPTTTAVFGTGPAF